MKNTAIFLSLLGIAISGTAADNPLIGRGTAGLTNRAPAGLSSDPRIGRGTLGVVTNQIPYGTNVVPGLTNNLGGTNLTGATNGFGTTNGAGGGAVAPGTGPLRPPTSPAVPTQPLKPGNPILPPPRTPAAPGSPNPSVPKV